MRGSGTIHIAATATYRTNETYGAKNAVTTAMPYRIGDSVPFRLSASASPRVGVWPGAAISARTRNAYENAARIRTMPYAAIGSDANWVSPIHDVTNGTSESQNSRSMFAQRTRPLTVLAAWSR